jgi:hypothetical protein
MAKILPIFIHKFGKRYSMSGHTIAFDRIMCNSENMSELYKFVGTGGCPKVKSKREYIKVIKDKASLYDVKLIILDSFENCKKFERKFDK